MCDKAVGTSPPALKVVPDWFVTNRMVEIPDNVVISENSVVFVNEDSHNVTRFSDNVGLNTIYVNNINLDNENFVDDDPGAIIHVKFIVWCDRYKQCKIFKKI